MKRPWVSIIAVPHLGLEAFCFLFLLLLVKTQWTERSGKKMLLCGDGFAKPTP